MSSEVEKKEDIKVEAAKPQPQPEVTPQPTPEAQKPQEETPEQINWRRFREERAKERKQKEESDRRAAEESQKAAAFKAALEAITNKPAIQNKHNDFDDQESQESEDERIEKKIAKLLQERETKMIEERQKQEMEQLPKTLLQAHQDFNQVCSQENVDYLEYHYPEVVAAYKYMPEGFDKWSSLYKAVKKLVPNTDGRKEAKKAEQNLSKPQSASRQGLFLGQGTVPASSVRLSEDQKAANWARMQRELNKI